MVVYALNVVPNCAQLVTWPSQKSVIYVMCSELSGHLSHWVNDCSNCKRKRVNSLYWTSPAPVNTGNIMIRDRKGCVDDSTITAGYLSVHVRYCFTEIKRQIAERSIWEPECVTIWSEIKYFLLLGNRNSCIIVLLINTLITQIRTGTSLFYTMFISWQMETVRLWNLFPLSAIFRDNSLSNGPVTAQFTFLFNFRPNHQLKQNDSSVSFQNIYESPPSMCGSGTKFEH